MRTKVYCGPLHALVGQRALVLEPEYINGTWVVNAQFNGDKQGEWRLPEEFWLKHPETGVPLAFGWHPFPADHFKELDE